MSITQQATELTSSTEGSAEIDGTRTYTRIFQVISDTPTEQAPIVEIAPGVPRFGQSHPTQSAATVRKVRAIRSTNSRLVWQVTVEYSNTPFEDSDGSDASAFNANPRKKSPLKKDKDKDPEDWRDRWNISTVNATIVIEKDLDGITIATTNGEPFDPPQTLEVANLAIRIQLFKRNFSLDNDINRFIYKVNSVQMGKFPPGVIICGGISAEMMVDREGEAIHRIEYNFLTHNRWNIEGAKQEKPLAAWQLLLANRGYIIKDVNGNLVRAVDEEQNSVTEPVFLAEDGTQLTKDQIKSGGVYLRAFRVRGSTNFYQTLVKRETFDTILNK